MKNPTLTTSRRSFLKNTALAGGALLIGFDPVPLWFRIFFK